MNEKQNLDKKICQNFLKPRAKITLQAQEKTNTLKDLMNN